MQRVRLFLCTLVSVGGWTQNQVEQQWERQHIVKISNNQMIVMLWFHGFTITSWFDVLAVCILQTMNVAQHIMLITCAIVALLRVILWFASGGKRKAYTHKYMQDFGFLKHNKTRWAIVDLCSKHCTVHTFLTPCYNSYHLHNPLSIFYELGI